MILVIFSLLSIGVLELWYPESDRGEEEEASS
jgi:hypothetical protein